MGIGRRISLAEANRLAMEIMKRAEEGREATAGIGEISSMNSVDLSQVPWQKWAACVDYLCRGKISIRIGWSAEHEEFCYWYFLGRNDDLGIEPEKWVGPFDTPLEAVFAAVDVLGY